MGNKIDAALRVILVAGLNFSIQIPVANAEVYKCTDPNGAITYHNDKPPFASCKALTGESPSTSKGPASGAPRTGGANSATTARRYARQGEADGREFAYDNKVRGIEVTKDVCLAGSMVAARNLPTNVPLTMGNEYGAGVYNGCMANR